RAHRLCAPARAAVSLSRLLDRGLAQDELQDALSAAGASGPERLGAGSGAGAVGVIFSRCGNDACAAPGSRVRLRLPGMTGGAGGALRVSPRPEWSSAP